MNALTGALGAFCLILSLEATDLNQSFDKLALDAAADSQRDDSTSAAPGGAQSRAARDTHSSLISQMAEPGVFSESLSSPRLVDVTSVPTPAPARSAKPSLFDAMPDRGASADFPVTFSPLQLDEQYGPPSVPFGAADAAYGQSSDAALAGLIRRYLGASAGRAASAAPADQRGSPAAPASAFKSPGAAAGPRPLPETYGLPQQATPAAFSVQPPSPAPSPVQSYVAPLTTFTTYTVQAPGAAPIPAQSYNIPQAAPVPVQSYSLPQAAPAPVQSYSLPQAAPAPVQSYSLPQAAPAPVQSYSSPQAAPILYSAQQPGTVLTPAGAAPVQSYGSPARQSPVLAVAAPTLQQPAATYSVVQQPSLSVPSPAPSFVVQNPVAAVPHSYSTPARNPLLTPQLAYVTPVGGGALGVQRDSSRGSDSSKGLVISLGGASIQLGGDSGTSIRLDAGGRSSRDEGASGAGSSITIIAGGAAAQAAPSAPVPPPRTGFAARSNRNDAPRDPPAPPSSYGPLSRPTVLPTHRRRRRR
ncbi:flocculation protein FLO11-like [Pollicipes pollicipes]|uniref:flocculation protein FLO11-like n=1 Tax=Pollicipes pollicipes TaxID=41117 RepID=UPI001884B5F7|nr:flocculation protein FLO11-like [Pollicipes pollicipes]